MEGILELLVLWPTLWLILMFTNNASAQLYPNDYIIKVSSECPPYPNGTARVQVLTDVPDAFPYVVCYDDWVFDMIQLDAGTWTIDVVFSTADESWECLFNQKETSNTFVIYTYVPMTSGLILGDEPPHVITCTYDSHDVFNTSGAQFADSKKPIYEKLENMGPASQSDVELRVVDVRGDVLHGRIRLGRTIQLKARLVGNFTEEASFQAVSCRAIGSRSNYNILIGGCGDGTVIPLNRGFNTTGKTAVSPYFKSFKLPGSTSLTFDCTFVICSRECDGDSCELRDNGRRKRHLNKREATFYIDQNYRVRSPRLLLPPDFKVETSPPDNSPPVEDGQLPVQHPDKDPSQAENIEILDPPLNMKEVEQMMVILVVTPFGFIALFMVMFVWTLSRTLDSLTKVQQDLDTHRKQYYLSIHAKTASDI